MSAKISDQAPRYPAIQERAALAWQIRYWRKGKNMSRRQLTRLSGLPVSACRRLEDGVSDPKYSTLVRIARGLSISTYELLFQVPPSEERLDKFAFNVEPGRSLLDQKLDALSQALMLVPGVTKTHKSFAMVEYDPQTGDKRIYCKFMSDHGKTDEANGRALGKYLSSVGLAWASPKGEGNRRKVFLCNPRQVLAHFLK